MENTKAIYRCTEENVDGCGSSATEYVSFPRRLTEQEFEMFQECEFRMGSTPGESGISPEQIQKAEQVLIDNGIETDEHRQYCRRLDMFSLIRRCILKIE